VSGSCNAFVFAEKSFEVRVKRTSNADDFLHPERKCGGSAA